MNDTPNLSKVTRWAEGGAVATLVSLATGGVPIVVLLLSGWGWGWYVLPFVSGALVLLALVLDLWFRRRVSPRHAPIPPAAIEIAHERFTVPASPQAPNEAVKPPDVPATGLSQAAPRFPPQSPAAS
jgi:hypothetical protein